jgi:hypothetical protein
MVALYLALSIPAFNFLGALSSLLAAFHWYRAAPMTNASKARRWRKAYLSCQVDVGEAAVILQRGEDSDVDGIKPNNRHFMLYRLPHTAYIGELSQNRKMFGRICRFLATMIGRSRPSAAEWRHARETRFDPSARRPNLGKRQ